MRILHASDLHASVANERDQRRIVAAMLVDAATFHAQIPIEAVVFTGDLAFAGVGDDLALASSILLDPLERALGLQRDRVVLVPGNHDVERHRIDEVVEKGLLAVLTDPDSVNRIVAAPEKLAQASDRLAPWLAFQQEFYSDLSNVEAAGHLARVHIIETTQGTLGIAALNSAWRSSGDADRERLLVGELQVTSAIDAIRGCSVGVVAAHHPLDWLAKFDADMLRAQLQGHDLLLLTGHEHEPNPEQMWSARGALMHVRGGCLYETRDYANTYAIIDIDPRDPSVTVSIREWYPTRGSNGEFDVATRIARGGAVTLTRGTDAARGHPPYSVVMSGLTALVREQSVVLDTAEAEDVLGLDELLVPPRLFSAPYREATAARKAAGHGGSDATNPVSAEARKTLAALDEPKVVIVCGTSHLDGVTTTLIWLLAEQFKASDTRLPVYLPSGTKLGTRRGRELLDAAAARVGYGRTGAGLPNLVVAVDNVAPTKQLDRLVAFIRESPSHAFILGTHGDDHTAIADALDRQGVQHERVFLWPFSRPQLRALVTRVGGRGDDRLVDAVSGLIRSNRLPRNPFIMAALIAVLKAQGDLTTVNESTVFVAYANLLLGGLDIGDAEGLSQDYRRREYLLGCLAEELLWAPDQRISRLEAEHFVIEYFREHSYTPSPVAVLQSFIDRRVLIEEDGRVGFRHGAILHLFAGHRMNDPGHADFRSKILADALRFSPTILHASGLSRNDHDLLRVIGDKLDAALATVTASVDVGSFDRLLGSDAQQEANLELLRQQIAATVPRPAPSDEDIDRIHELLDGEDEDEARQPDALFDLQDATDLLAGVLKNSELVSDVDLKTRSLATTIEAQTVLAAAYAAGEEQTHLVRELVVSVSNATHDAETRAAPTNDEIDHDIRVVATVLVVLRTLSGVGTPHLRTAVERALGDVDFMSSPGRAVLATMLAWMLELPAWPQKTIDLYGRHPDQPLLRELTRAWAINMYNSTESDAAVRTLEPFLANVYSSGGEQSAEVKEQVRVQLKRGRLRYKALRAGDLLAPDDDLEELVVEGTVDEPPYASAD